VIHFLQVLLDLVALVWYLANLAVQIRRRAGTTSGPSLAKVVRRQLGPVFLPSIFGSVVIDALTGQIHGGAGVALDGIRVVVAILAWITRGRDDDDDWKRLLHRIAGRVRSLGHRLTVEPEGASA
jgi:hypothetical protein